MAFKVLLFRLDGSVRDLSVTNMVVAPSLGEVIDIDVEGHAVRARVYRVHVPRGNSLEWMAWSQVTATEL